MDVLTSLVNGLNLHAKLIYSGGVCGRWLMDHNSDRSVFFHMLSKGEGWVYTSKWDAPLLLEKGDLILFLPHSDEHFLSYSKDHLPDTMSDTQLTPWADGEAGFVCGEIELGMPESLIWRALPPEIVIKRSQAGDVLTRLIELVNMEASVPRFGSGSVVERLCDSIFILAMRHCIENELVDRGVFSAMQDRRLATVLNLIHEQPWKPWTIAEFCRRAGTSKTMLSEKFAASIGASPIEYLVQWRMQIASHWLREPGMTIERVAERCGYESVPAFSKAFKRTFAKTPGVYRREALANESKPVGAELLRVLSRAGAT